MRAKKCGTKKGAGRHVLGMLMLAICWLAATPRPAASMLACGPVGMGAPCGEGGPAILPQTDGPGLGVGNPVHAASGNKYQRETDMPALPGILGLELVRHYNAFDTRVGPLGTGWSWSYDTRLYRVGGGLQIVQADGSRLAFHPSAQPGVATAERPGDGVVELLDAESAAPGHAAPAYRWRWRDGRRLEFNRHGGLIAILAATGERLSIERGGVPGQPLFQHILRVSDPAGRALYMHYSADASEVSGVMTPAGVVVYRHAQHLLRAAVYPDGHWRGYLYEAAYQAGGASRLTGIVAGRPDGGRVRLNSWLYDEDGRVRRATQGEPDSLQGRLDMHYETAGANTAAGVTVVSHGVRTRIRTQVRGGRHVVEQVSGPPCPGCAPALRARYDEAGGWTGGDGATVRRDPLGRVAGWGPNGEVRVQWWRDTTLPARISRPSVVPGRRHVIDIDWQTGGATGQSVLPVAITESGWRPAAPGFRSIAAGGGAKVQRLRRHLALDWHEAPTGSSLRGVTADPVMTAPPAGPGPEMEWPGLDYRLDDFGQVLQWRSAATGVETLAYDARQRLASRTFANGASWRYAHDEQGRLARLELIAAPGDAATRADVVELGWRQGMPARIANAWETQERTFDAAGHVQSRRVRRAAPGPAAALDYSERFERDGQGRVLRHWLPEGGLLHYRWGAGGRLQGIAWQDRAGRIVHVLRTEDGRAGYVQSNGIRLRPALREGRLGALAYLDGATPLFAQSLHYDAAGRIAAESLRHAGDATRRLFHAYDARSRQIASAAAWHAWHDDGSARAWRDSRGGTTVLEIRRDASGLPRRVGTRTLRYGANRRLIQVDENGVTLARYWHNAQGERIARQGREGGLTQYLFDAGRVVAEWRADASGKAGVVRRYVYAGDVPLALIVYAGPQATPAPAAFSAATPWREARSGLPPRHAVYAIHTDAQGWPRLLSDAAGRVRWRADYTAWGEVTAEQGDLSLPLRLPGQFADPDTGWHDNYLRTYDPAAGHFLEPDPLGPAALLPGGVLPPGWRPVTAPFAYAAQQPRRYADSSGLVLFAFDGTRESAVTATNVYQMALLYRNAADAAAGLPEIHYQPGPGNASGADLDAALAHTADAILATQWRLLLQHLSAFQSGSETAAIDLLGYSRGAALARHFGNQVANAVRNGRFWHQEAGQGAVTACVDLRFMGLFDSVAQFGLLGMRNAAYDFSIAPDWRQVAHAVALHERRALFPLLSAAQPDGGLPANVIEQPFVGAHGDIGGGLVDSRPGREDLHDLSDVALAWMLELGRRSGLVFDAPLPAQRLVSDPVLHDLRSRGQRLSQHLVDAYGASAAWQPSDRRVLSARDTELVRYQDDHAQYGRQARAETEAFIHRIAGWMDSDEPVVGLVDMAAYAVWLAGLDRGAAP